MSKNNTFSKQGLYSVHMFSPAGKTLKKYFCQFPVNICLRNKSCPEIMYKVESLCFIFAIFLHLFK